MADHLAGYADVQALHQALADDPRPPVRGTLCTAIGRHGDPASIDVLAPLLHGELAEEAADALGNIGGDRILGPLLAALGRVSGDRHRAAIAHALAEGEDGAVTTLDGLARDPKEANATRRAATDALERLATPAAVAALEDLPIPDDDPRPLMPATRARFVLINNLEDAWDEADWQPAQPGLLDPPYAAQPRGGDLRLLVAEPIQVAPTTWLGRYRVAGEHSSWPFPRRPAAVWGGDAEGVRTAIDASLMLLLVHGRGVRDG